MREPNEPIKGAGQTSDLRTLNVAFVVERMTHGGTERASLNVARALAELAPDWVVAFNQGYVELLLSGAFGSYRTVLSERYHAPSHYAGKPLKRLFSRWLYGRSDRVVFQTAASRDCYGESIRRRSAIIPNMVTSDLPRYRLLEENRAIVTMSRLEPQKNLPLLIETFALFHADHPDYTLRMYGNGSMREELLELIEQRGLSQCAFVLPFRKDVHNDILDARMFVSSSKFEGMQNALLEALAMGIPCAATDCAGGGARELLDDGARGLLVPADDAQALARAMAVLADDDDAAQHYAAAGLSVNDVYGKDAVAARWLALLNGDDVEAGR